MPVVLVAVVLMEIGRDAGDEIKWDAIDVGVGCNLFGKIN